MRPKWLKLASLAQKTCTPKGYHFKNIFDFTTAGDWDCVAVVERLPALHYSDLFYCPLGSWVSLCNFETIRGSLMRLKWPKLASLGQKNMHTLVSVLWCILCFQRKPFKEHI